MELNIRTDKEVELQAERISCHSGLNISTAAAIAEGRAIAFDKNEKGYSSMADLRTALEE